MATFDDATVGTSTNGTAPDFGLSKKSEPAIRTTKFGDGYEQRVGFGLNQSPKEWIPRMVKQNQRRHRRDRSIF
jgi:phage-related protein